MTTPREDAIATLDVERLAYALNRAFGVQVVGGPLNTIGADPMAAARSLAREYAALGSGAETPDPDLIDAYHDEEANENAAPVHWVDLASPETAEALARALGAVTREVLYVGDRQGEAWRRATAAAILAAMRETGR